VTPNKDEYQKSVYCYDIEFTISPFDYMHNDGGET